MLQSSQTLTHGLLRSCEASACCVAASSDSICYGLANKELGCWIIWQRSIFGSLVMTRPNLHPSTPSIQLRYPRSPCKSHLLLSQLLRLEALCSQTCPLQAAQKPELSGFPAGGLETTAQYKQAYLSEADSSLWRPPPGNGLAVCQACAGTGESLLCHALASWENLHFSNTASVFPLLLALHMTFPLQICLLTTVTC